ncbi:dihydroxyacetone kinase subunit DhaL [Nocardia sp. NPDC049190]|uniref:dihydroxyacetone kinase subunit DhaL n=1 Tax=Nocardia sp. NPDC049190 TaxID=3155650 RepID=UPI0033E2669B
MSAVDPIRWLRDFAALIDEHTDELTELDAAIGDADHGSNMRRGTAAVVAAFDEPSAPLPSAVLKQAGMVLIRSIGGASGPLYGTFFLRAAAASAEAPLDATGFAKSFRAGLDGIVARGKAEAGDKTMFDALAPAADILDEKVSAGASLADALDAALAAVEAGRDATIPMLARKGRASYLGERSVGHQDPGATSAALLVRAARQAVL